MIELSYQRAPAREASGLIALLVGIVGGLVGFFGLLNTDGVGANTVFGIVMGVGILVAVIGWGRWRYDPLRRRGAFQIDGKAGRLHADRAGLRRRRPSSSLRVSNSDADYRIGILLSNGFARTVFMLGLGVAGILAVLVAAGKLPVWSPLVGILISAVPSIGFLMTRQAARGVFFVALVVAGLIILVLASNHAATQSASAGLAIELLTAVVVALLAFFIRWESTSQQFRTQLFTVMLLIALALVCSALMGYLYAVRSAPDPAADKLGRRAAIGGVVVLVTGHHPQDAVLDRGRERRHERRHPLPDLDPVVHPVRHLRHVAARPHPVRQLDLRRGRQQGGRPGRGRPGGPDQDHAVHAGLRRGLAERHAHRLPPDLGAGRPRQRPGVRVHHRRRRRRQPADRRLRLGGRRCHRLAHHVDVDAGHPVRRLEQQLAVPVPRRDPPAWPWPATTTSAARPSSPDDRPVVVAKSRRPS